METNSIIILLCVVVIASYLFTLLSKWSGIPSVLLLLSTGIAIRYTANFTGIDFGIMTEIVKFLGTTGLIMIVLEASLDLKLSKEKLPLILRALFSALSVLVVSALAVASILTFFLDVTFHSALIYALPLSIISSAVAIPSAEHLPEIKKEFIIYESSFSDIIGILFFYYLISNDAFSPSSVVEWSVSFFLMVVASLLLSIFLLYLASRLRTQVKIFLLLAILILMYSIAKEFHLPSLTLIMIFGLILSNVNLFLHPKTTSFINMDALAPTLKQFQSITTEISFLLRTYFFLLFGFTITLTSLGNFRLLSLGFMIVGAMLLIRFIYFRFFLHSNLFPEIFLMPRGLITILLFFSIPREQAIPYFDEGLLFFIILATGLLMTFGLVVYRANKKDVGELIV